MLITHLSDRNIPLVYNEFSERCILTIENYIKWYDIYIVSGHEVKKLPSKYANKYLKEDENRWAWGDHIPSPWFCKWLTESHSELEWDYCSYQLVVGRWICESSKNCLGGPGVITTLL